VAMTDARSELHLLAPLTEVFLRCAVPVGRLQLAADCCFCVRGGHRGHHRDGALVTPGVVRAGRAVLSSLFPGNGLYEKRLGDQAGGT
jgi:hypothetical protein